MQTFSCSTLLEILYEEALLFSKKNFDDRLRLLTEIIFCNGFMKRKYWA